MYDINELELAMERYKVLLAEAETARFRNMTKTSRPRSQNPVLMGVGNLLVSLGMRLKGASRLDSPSHSLRAA